jgi:hypothetical protein
MRATFPAHLIRLERWGSPLAQDEKYQGRKKTCDKMIIIIII